jgi:hemerythrin-like metal-binding protein
MEKRMPNIAWDSSMTTGVESLDSQHKQLITWLNDLLEAMSVGRGRSEIVGLLDQLGTYAGTHFGKEEECMTRYSCPAAAQNVDAHKDFVATFTSFRQEFDRDGATAHLVVRVEAELMKWLTTHMKRTDAQLAPCVKARAA